MEQLPKAILYMISFGKNLSITIMGIGGWMIMIYFFTKIADIEPATWLEELGCKMIFGGTIFYLVWLSLELLGQWLGVI